MNWAQFKDHVSHTLVLFYHPDLLHKRWQVKTFSENIQGKLKCISFLQNVKKQFDRTPSFYKYCFY